MLLDDLEKFQADTVYMRYTMLDFPASYAKLAQAYESDNNPDQYGYGKSGFSERWL